MPEPRSPQNVRLRETPGSIAPELSVVGFLSSIAETPLVTVTRVNPTLHNDKTEFYESKDNYYFVFMNQTMGIKEAWN